MKLYAVPAFLALIGLPVVSIGQAKLYNCDRVANGRFYYRYPDSRLRVNVYRKGNIQYEVEEATKDTTWLQLEWLSGCRYTMSFIRRTKPFDPGEEAFYRSVIVQSEIIQMTARYYITRTSSASSSSSEPFFTTDTLWFR